MRSTAAKNILIAGLLGACLGMSAPAATETMRVVPGKGRTYFVVLDYGETFQCSMHDGPYNHDKNDKEGDIEGKAQFPVDEYHAGPAEVIKITEREAKYMNVKAIGAGTGWATMVVPLIDPRTGKPWMMEDPNWPGQQTQRQGIKEWEFTVIKKKTDGSEPMSGSGDGDERDDDLTAKIDEIILSGKVIHKRTRSPVADVTIELVPLDAGISPIRQSWKSGADGRFTVKASKIVPAGRFKIQAFKRAPAPSAEPAIMDGSKAVLRDLWPIREYTVSITEEMNGRPYDLGEIEVDGAEELWPAEGEGEKTEPKEIAPAEKTTKPPTTETSSSTTEGGGDGTAVTETPVPDKTKDVKKKDDKKKDEKKKGEKKKDETEKEVPPPAAHPPSEPDPCWGSLAMAPAAAGFALPAHKAEMTRTYTGMNDCDGRRAEMTLSFEGRNAFGTLTAFPVKEPNIRLQKTVFTFDGELKGEKCEWESEKSIIEGTWLGSEFNVDGSIWEGFPATGDFTMRKGRAWDGGDAIILQRTGAKAGYEFPLQGTYYTCTGPARKPEKTCTYFGNNECDGRSAELTINFEKGKAYGSLKVKGVKETSIHLQDTDFDFDGALTGAWEDKGATISAQWIGGDYDSAGKKMVGTPASGSVTIKVTEQLKRGKDMVKVIMLKRAEGPCAYYFEPQNCNYKSTNTAADKIGVTSGIGEARDFAKNLKAGAGALDLVFCIDKTSSMSDDIDAVKKAAAEVVKALSAKVSDFRVAVIAYSDWGESEMFTDYPFSSNPDEIIKNINGITVNGGGDFPEAVLEALMRAIDSSVIGGWRNKVNKHIILMGDAPPRDPSKEGLTAAIVAKAAFDADPVVINTVAVGNSGKVDESTQKAFSELSKLSGGADLKAEDAASVPDKIVESIKSIKMETAAPQIELEVASVQRGGRIVARIKDFAPEEGRSAKAWIAFYKADAPADQYVSYTFLNNLSEDTYDVTAPDEPGQYIFRLFKDEGYEPLCTSGPVTVVP